MLSYSRATFSPIAYRNIDYVFLFRPCSEQLFHGTPVSYEKALLKNFARKIHTKIPAIEIPFW